MSLLKAKVDRLRDACSIAILSGFDKCAGEDCRRARLKKIDLILSMRGNRIPIEIRLGFGAPNLRGLTEVSQGWPLSLPPDQMLCAPAATYAALGEKTKAIASLEKGYAQARRRLPKGVE